MNNDKSRPSFALQPHKSGAHIHYSHHISTEILKAITDKAKTMNMKPVDMASRPSSPPNCPADMTKSTHLTF
ncbi:MAG: hypothetical protein LBH04_04905 [Tannerellaceae bacterium]|nr:hypothetical protein [Tannerellaceae bacterium]